MKVACMQDVECLSCRSKFKVNVTMEGSAKWALYQNPNAVKIRTNLPNLKKFLKIRPDAFAFVNQNIDKTICPCCNSPMLNIESIVKKDMIFTLLRYRFSQAFTKVFVFSRGPAARGPLKVFFFFD